MAVTSAWFGRCLINALGGDSAGEAPNIDFLSDSIKVALFTSSLTIDQDANEFFDAAPYTSNQVASGNGYTTGGQALANKTITYTAGTNVIALDADDVTWGSSTITARYAVIYDDTPASNKPLIGYVNFGADMASSNGNFTISWNASGICKITVGAEA